jgi:CRISPR-associated protein Cas5d
VERVRYDVITPSATRALFAAIFWKPAIHWQVTKIEVLNPIKWTSIRRNEVGAVASKIPVFIEDKRQQKNTLCLKDVRYRIWAKLEFVPVHKRKGEKLPLADESTHPDENPAKYNAMFERRASKGQCFNQPYLGTRECSCSFKLVNPETEKLSAPISENRDLGIMLYDMDFEQNLKNPPAMFYRAKMENGMIIVPPKDSKEVLR